MENRQFNKGSMPADIPRLSSIPEFPGVLSAASSRNSTYVDEEAIQIPPAVSLALDAKGLQADRDGTVTWAPDGGAHPRKWSLLRKVYDTSIICFFQYFTTMISNVGSSIAADAAHDLGITTEVAIFCFTTLYLIGQAIGGLVLPPISESFGGRTIYVSSALSFAIFSFVMGAVPNLPIIITFRLLTGFLSAMPAVVAAGSFENMWGITSRAFVLHIWISGSIVGLASGPPIATYLTTSSIGWSWVFRLSGYVMVVLTVACFWMEESRPSRVLRKEVRAVADETKFRGLSLDNEYSLPSLSAFIKTSLVLPIRLFLTEPIVTLTAILAATACGLVYLFGDALPVVYQDSYGFGPRQASLTNLAFAVGVLFTILPRIVDVRTMNKLRREHMTLDPEDKLFGFQIAAPVLAAGLWWFALTVPPLIKSSSPWASIASMVLVGFSVVEFGSILAGYLCDSYTQHAASANAPMAFLRAMLSGVFPLFGRQFFQGLGSNYALFILAGIATIFCAVPVLFVKYGKRFRERSSFADHSSTPTEQEERSDESDRSRPHVSVPESVYSREV